MNLENNSNIQEHLKNNPVVVLNEKDFDIFLLKFGSLLFLLNNKNINPTLLFISLVKDENLQNIFKKMSGMPTLLEILKTILIYYPNLIKSKIVKDNSIKILKQQNRKHLKQSKKNVIKRRSKKAV